MNLTYYGHSCFSVKVGGKTLLFDPFITPNPLAKDIDPTQIEAEYILISHGHEDHVADAVEIAKRTGAKVISNFEIVVWFNKQGVQNAHPLNHGGSVELEFGKVQFVNAIHSSTLPDGRSGGNPGGFVIDSPEGSFYFTGDTALTNDMKLIPEGRELKFAAMCIGDTFTMGIDDAIKAADFVQCKNVVGVHFDTFPPIEIDHDAATSKFEAAGKQLHLLKPGQSQDL